MGRFVTPPRGVEWAVWQLGNGKYKNSAVERCLLLDIRRELQSTNRLLRQIASNTKPKKRRKARK